MRIIIYGAGAVGSVIGGRLSQAGTDVVLVARPAHADAINRDGLLLRTGVHDQRVRVHSITDLTELSPTEDDVVVITAKTQDTPAIHDAIARWDRNTIVVCATNGVEHERIALRLFPHVYAMVVQMPATFEKPGEVTALCMPTNAVLDVGRYPSGSDDVARALAATLDAAPHLSSVADANVMTKKYEKVLINVGNTADALCGPVGRNSAVVVASQAEGRAVFAAAGIEMSADDVDDPYRARLATMRFSIPTGATFIGGSTWQSLAKGATSVETDYFNGEIALLGRLHHIATPANTFLQNLAHHLVRRGAAPGTFTCDELDALWRANRFEHPLPT